MVALAPNSATSPCHYWEEVHGRFRLPVDESAVSSKSCPAGTAESQRSRGILCDPPDMISVGPSCTITSVCPVLSSEATAPILWRSIRRNIRITSSKHETPQTGPLRVPPSNESSNSDGKLNSLRGHGTHSSVGGVERQVHNDSWMYCTVKGEQRQRNIFRRIASSIPIVFPHSRRSSHLHGILCNHLRRPHAMQSHLVSHS